MVRVLCTGTSRFKICVDDHFRYNIIGGDGASNFTIDTINGKIDPLGIIDFESIPQHSGDEKHFSPRYIKFHDKIAMVAIVLHGTYLT